MADITAVEESSPSFSIKDRGIAVENAYAFLQRLPWRRGFAVYRAMEEGRSLSRHYSLFDMVDFPRDRQKSELSKKPDHVEYMESLRNKYPGILPQKERTSRAIIQEDREPGFVPKLSEILQKGNLDVRDLDLVFSPRYGSVLFPGSLGMENSFFGKFFTPERRLGNPFLKNDLIDLRGSNYMVAVDETYSLDGKLKIVKGDLKEGIKYVSEAVGKRGSIDNPRDLLLYLGILDYLKMHSMTLFNALTFSERELTTPQDTKYSFLRQQSERMMETFVRMYYQTLLGLDYDKNLDFSDLSFSADTLPDYIQDLIVGQVGNLRENSHELKAETNKRFRYPEAFISPMLALGAREAVERYPETDIIVAIPTGGTELAIATKLAYELSSQRQGSKTCELVYLPISLHSCLGKITVADLKNFLARYYPSLFQDKNILLVDDNSASGKTLTCVSDALDGQARRVNALVADFDPRKLLTPERRKEYSNSSVFEATLNINKISDSGGEIAREDLKRKIGFCHGQIKQEKEKRRQIGRLTRVMKGIEERRSSS